MMGEAKRRRLHKIDAGTKLDFTDFSDFPEKLEALIDADQVTGALTFYMLKSEIPGVFKTSMVNAGMTPEEVFDILCLMRRSMMETMGFADLADAKMTERRE